MTTDEEKRKRHIISLFFLLLVFAIISFCCPVFPVGSYVWTHLTNVLRSEDPMKQALIESLPDDIISRDFATEFLKYSSYSDNTVATGENNFML